MAFFIHLICCGWCNSILTIFDTRHKFIVVVRLIVDNGLSHFGMHFGKKRITFSNIARHVM
jgi:hypothetical protein